MESIYQHAGGHEGLHRFIGIFYGSVLADPLLQPLFGAGRPDHVDHLTEFEAESFGGPDNFSRELGFAHLIAVHRGLKITEEQRARFVQLYLAAADAAGLPGDPRSGRRCARTSSSVRRWRCRTPMPRPTTSCIRCGKCPGGSGRPRRAGNRAAGGRAVSPQARPERCRPAGAGK
jgi:truncated hemoglobin YjbI